MLFRVRFFGQTRIKLHCGTLQNGRFFCAFQRKFETEKEAESYAHEMSKKWIDDGKPDILPESFDRE
jgi:hypothetical protein